MNANLQILTESRPRLLPLGGLTRLAGPGLVEGGDPELVLLPLGESLGRPLAPVALDLAALLPLHVAPGPLLDYVSVSSVIFILQSWFCI